MENKIQLKRLSDCIYLMNDGDSTGYIVLGSEKAAVIDTMNGFGNVMDVVRSVTELPVTVINTHGHCDHIFGNIFCEKAYINFADMPVVKEHTAFPDFVERCRKYNREMPEFLPINDGDIFDLGGRSLEVISLPGHTQGEICLLLEKDRVLFTGDGINRHVWMQLRESTDLRTFAENMDKIAYVKEKADYILHGHTLDFDPIALFDELRGGLQELLDGGTENDSPYIWFGGEDVIHTYGNGNAIVYKKGRI